MDVHRLLMLAELSLSIVVVVAVVGVVLMLLIVHVISRDPNVRDTRWGFYVARERYEDETAGPDAAAASESEPDQTQVTPPPWPKRDGP